MRELVGGKNTVGRTAAVLKKPQKGTFNLFFNMNIKVAVIFYIKTLSNCFVQLCSLKMGRWGLKLVRIGVSVVRNLRAIPQNTFQDAFQNWKKRWERCINSGGEYFEGDNFD